MGCCAGKPKAPETADDLKRKVIVVGDGGAGKTCLIRRYINKEFDEFTPDSLIPSSLETYDIERDYKGKKMVTVLCDTGGQETFKHLRKTSYPNSDIIIVCFSLDNKESLKSVHNLWVIEMRKLCPGVPIILVGCKQDLRDDAQNKDGFVRESEGHSTAKKHKMLTYIETSSLTGDNVDKVFDLAIEEAVKRKKHAPRKSEFDSV